MDVTFRALHDAADRCRKGKSKGAGSQWYEAHRLDNLLSTLTALQTYHWHPSPMRRFIAQNGSKPREIHAPHYRDRVVHHWLVPKLRALIEPKFIYDCAANIQGRGTHFAVQRLQKMMRHDETAWFMQLDIRNFFYSIHHDILLSLLQRHLNRAVKQRAIPPEQATDWHWLACQIVTAPIYVKTGQPIETTSIPAHKQLSACVEGVGLPIGNLSSQFFSNLYMNELDQYVKHSLKVKHYLRYVDDFILLGPDRTTLLNQKAEIEQFLQHTLRLRPKPEFACRPVRDGADFLGYIVRPHYCLLRRRVVNNWHQRLNTWEQAHVTWIGGVGERNYRCVSADQSALTQLRQWAASYNGQLSHAQGGNVIREIEQRFSWLSQLLSISAHGIAARFDLANTNNYVQQVAKARSNNPDTVLLLQKGSEVHVYEPGAPERKVALAWLQVTIQYYLNQACHSLAWFKQTGQQHARLKQRQLALLYYREEKS